MTPYDENYGLLVNSNTTLHRMYFKEMAKLLANVDKDELDKIIKAVYKNNKPKKESIQHRKRDKLCL